MLWWRVPSLMSTEPSLVCPCPCSSVHDVGASTRSHGRGTPSEGGTRETKRRCLKRVCLKRRMKIGGISGAASCVSFTELNTAVPSCVDGGSSCDGGESAALRTFARSVDGALEEPLAAVTAARRAFEQRVCDHLYAEHGDKPVELATAYGADGPMIPGHSYLYELALWNRALHTLSRACQQDVEGFFCCCCRWWFRRCPCWWPLEAAPTAGAGAEVVDRFLQRVRYTRKICVECVLDWSHSRTWRGWGPVGVYVWFPLGLWTLPSPQEMRRVGSTLSHTQSGTGVTTKPAALYKVQVSRQHKEGPRPAGPSPASSANGSCQRCLLR